MFLDDGREQLSKIAAKVKSDSRKKYICYHEQHSVPHKSSQGIIEEPTKLSPLQVFIRHIHEEYMDLSDVRRMGNLILDEINLTNAPDLLLTVAILAAVAEGETKITGIGHARLKETDRIDTTCRELEKLGCELQEFEDSIIIKGKTISEGVVNSHKDHRLAMAFSLLGLKENVEVEDGECFDVSFPNFIEAMAEIGVELELN